MRANFHVFKAVVAKSKQESFGQYAFGSVENFSYFPVVTSQMQPIHPSNSFDETNPPLNTNPGSIKSGTMGESERK